MIIKMNSIDHDNMQHYKNIIPPATIRLLIITEAPPLPEENYFYNISNNDYVHDSSRSFFRGIMQGIGILSIGVSVYGESTLLDVFTREGYFIIDSCPIPLVDEARVQLSSDKKRRIMVNYTDSLLETIKALQPERILFVCSTNKVVLDKLKDDPYISDRLLLARPLPYPGVGWLRRPDQKGFIDLFPECYRLAAIY